jgi:hypothetical protein
MVGEQYFAQFDGIVVAQTDYVHYPPWTRNLATRYVLRQADGSQVVFHVDPGMGHLNGFALGTHLTKQRWRFNYEADGHSRNDFPLPFYLLFVILDSGLLIAAVVIGVMINNRERRERELNDAVERGRRLLEEEP